MHSIGHHQLHFESAVDGERVVYLVSAPDPLPAEPIPAVWQLHDHLNEPTPSEFIESAFRQADLWRPMMKASPPAILVQPFGRGNAGWHGAALRDVLGIQSELSLKFRVSQHALVGVGSGGTGALLLAAWFPGKFSTVAAIGAWTDERFDVPIGMDDWPEWERLTRRAFSPRHLATNYGGGKLILGHPHRFNGIANRPRREHFESFAATLENLDIEFVALRDPEHWIGSVDDIPQREELWQHLIAPPMSGSSVGFKTMFARSEGTEACRVIRRENPGRPATVVVQLENDIKTIETRNVAVLAVDTEAHKRLSIDGFEFDLARSAARFRTFEKLDDQWLTANLWGPDADGKTADRSGPVFDLFWDQVTLVAGTLGSDEESVAHRDFLQGLADRWKTGDDSPWPYAGSKSATREFRVITDVEYEADPVAGNVVLVGSPRTNATLARWAERLPVRWLAGAEVDSFKLRGVTYNDPLDVGFVLGPIPDREAGYVLTIAAASIRGLADADRVRVSLLPDFFVLRGREVRIWGYFGEQWG